MPSLFHCPWLGTVSNKFEKLITTAIQHCYFAVETRVLFTTRPLLSATKKNLLPTHHHNNVIYQFVCHCDSRYVGRTSQRLQAHIKQKVSRSIKNYHSSPDCFNLSRTCKKKAFLKSPPVTLLLDSIFWKTLPVPHNTVTLNFLSLPEDLLLSTSPLLKLCLSNCFYQSLSTQKISLQFKTHLFSPFYFHF